jgi:hypothetical protein
MTGNVFIKRRAQTLRFWTEATQPGQLQTEWASERIA